MTIGYILYKEKPINLIWFFFSCYYLWVFLFLFFCGFSDFRKSNNENVYIINII